MNYLYAMAVIMISTVLAVLSKYPDYYWLIVSDFNVALALFLAWAMEKKND